MHWRSCRDHRMRAIKKIWIKVCVAAIGINIGLFIYALLLSKYDLMPLAIVNCLLLSTIFLVPDPHDN